MIADIRTILWKEFRELFQARQGMFGRGGWISIAITVGLLGVLIPIQAGEEWVSSPIHMIWWVWVPFLMVTYIVTDTFAGERERHTLETLLASRLHDQTILFGKIISVVLYGWGIAIIGLMVGLITVNITAGKGRLLMYSPEAALAILALSLLFSLLSSAIGVLISLRSSTVRQAQQVTGLISLIPILPIVLLDVLPDEIIANLMASMSQVNGSMVVLVVVGILAVIDLAFIALAMKHFQRAKLIMN
jgi:ABC-2 type transport system permease protein